MKNEATLRNWLIGYYIAEYEMDGKDRAEYGDRRQLYRYHRFYSFHPGIVGTLPPQLQPADFKTIANSGDGVPRIVRSATTLSGIEPQKLISPLMELPKKEDMQEFIEEQMREA